MPPESSHSRFTPSHPTRLARAVVAVLTAALVATLGGVGGGAPAALGAGSGASSPWLAATDTDGPTILDATVRFFGRGYGHGVGMSQHGARGRALAGQDAATILAHYYEGANLRTIDPATGIRVRILWKWVASPAGPLLVVGRGAPWTIEGIAGSFPKAAALRVIPTTTATPAGPRTTWQIEVAARDGAVLHVGPKPADLVVRGATSRGRLQLASKATSNNRYRGSLRIMTSSNTSKVKVVNTLPLESYLRGVVPAEMPSSWPTAALEAQAVAARSYAARRLRPGASYFDVTDTTSSQVYLGARAERTTTDAVIRSTAGVVLKSGGAIANTLFHSTGGGATEDNENVYTSSAGAKVAGPVSYLRGSSDRDPDGNPYDASAPYATWTTNLYSRDQLSGWFSADPRTAVGALTALDLRNRGVSGRLISVNLIGSLGTKVVSGEVFRSVFNAGRPSGDPLLRSTLLATEPIP